MSRKQQGSGLAAVMITAGVLAVGIYSVLSLAEGEFKRNKKSALYHEARLGAEALLQNAMAELRVRLQTSFAEGALDPGQTPLRVTDEFASRYAGFDPASNLIIPNSRNYTTWDAYGQETELLGGKVKALTNAGDFVYIDPRIPGNEDDPLAGTMVLVRSIEMISKATAERSGSGRSTVHARQFLQVREAPLFAYAIFYNLPLEIAPGAAMDVVGKVHGNEDVWVQTDATLRFHERFTTAGDLSHGRHPDSGKDDSYGAVTFEDGDGNDINLMEDASWLVNNEVVANAFNGGWLESSDNDFASFATDLWDGNVQTSDHGVEPMNLPGVSPYIEDTDPDTAEKESFNSAYALIQPPLEEGVQSGERAAREEQKFSYKAGLTIKVDGSGNLSYFTYQRDARGNLKYGDDGSPLRVGLSPSGYDRDSDSSTPPEPVARAEIFSDSNGVVTSGLHDKRQAADLNLVEVDVEVLKELLHGDGENSSDWGGEAPKEWWNGVVYVEFPQKNASSSRPDDVNPAIDGWGVKLVNGSVIPSPSYAVDKGTTFATNQILYVQGNYNADGQIAGSGDSGPSASATLPDDQANFGKEGYEAPAALVADSVTFLSNSWDDANSASPDLGTRVASPTEVSAAVLTGIVPSGEEGVSSYSGGVENFPRFLENWSGKDFAIRGSMVALFESEVGTRGWGLGNVYQPPNRKWGFHLEFGMGKLPPGTPMVRDFKAVDFEVISASEYADHFDRIKTEDFGG